MQTKKYMNCPLVHENLLGYIEDSLEDNVYSEVKRHLDSCEQCLILYQNIKETYTAFEKLPRPELDPFFSTRVLSTYFNKEAIGTSTSHKLIRILQPIAASILILFGVSAGIYLGKDLAVSKAIVSAPVLNNQTMETYASEYYLDDLGELSVANLIDNE